MRTPDVLVSTTQPDRLAPTITPTTPCQTQTNSECGVETPLQYCANIGATYIDFFFVSDEAGGVYYALSGLSANASTAAWTQCQALDIQPGQMYEVPIGEKWYGCTSPEASRRLQALTNLRGSAVGEDAVSTWDGRTHSLVETDIAQYQSISVARSLLDASNTGPSAGCLANQACACCRPNLNCLSTFQHTWSDRANLASAGNLLDAGCVHVEANSCQELQLAWSGPSVGAATPNGRRKRSLLNVGEMQATGRAPSLDYREGIKSSDISLLQESGDSTFLPDSIYMLFAVTEDQIRPEPNVLPVARQWIIRTQSATPPSCEVSCSLGASTTKYIHLDVALNTTGRVYYVLDPVTSNSAPTVSNVRSAASAACRACLTPVQGMAACCSGRHFAL
jgi:hypothetical protein